jgi:5-methylcytosine-specific restriction endonuclease McrA
MNTTQIPTKDARRRLRQKHSTPSVTNEKVTPASIHNALVLTLDAYWQPHKWVTVEDAIVYEAKELVQQHVGQDIFILHGGINAKTQTQSSIKTSTIIAIKGASKQQVRKPPMLSNRVLFRRDRHVCAYCGDVHTEAALTRDHIVPVSHGGKDNWMNVVTACYPCNNRKGDLSLKQAGLELLYIPYTPCHYENMLLQNRRILADQMTFLVNGIKNKDSRATLQ